jgi:hypothetical protein
MHVQDESTKVFVIESESWLGRGNRLVSARSLMADDFIKAGIA